MRHLYQLLVVVLLLLSMTVANSQPGRLPGKRPGLGQELAKWSKIGQKTVKRVSEYDEFIPPGFGIYTAIKLKVLNSRVQFDRLVIVFDNGRRMDIPLNVVIRENGESRIIDLPGDKRKIKRILFKYNTKGLFNDKAVVQVWGRR